MFPYNLQCFWDRECSRIKIINKRFVILMASTNGASKGFKDGMKEANQPTLTPQVTQGSEPSKEKEATDRFVDDVKIAIHSCLGENESFKEVTFDNDDLCVYVDFSKVDPAPLTIEDLAISRTSSITDAILELTQYDTLWNTITVDFGDLGEIKNSKDNMQKNELGGRYFPSWNFKLK